MSSHSIQFNTPIRKGSKKVPLDNLMLPVYAWVIQRIAYGGSMQMTAESATSKSKKIPYTISAEMEDALEVVHNRTGIPIARLVRNGIRMVLAEHGIEVEDSIRQGGLREKAHSGDLADEA